MGITVGAGEGENEIAHGDIEIAGGGPSGGHRVPSGFEGTSELAVRKFGGEGAGEGIDCSAEGRIAVAQGRRPTENLNLTEEKRLDGDAVVRTRRRNVECSHRVAQDADAEAIQSSDHRAAGSLAIRRGADSRLPAESVAQSALGNSFQNGFAHGVGGAEGMIVSE